MNSSDNNDAVARALQDWQLAPARDPQFRAAVWARIEAVQHGVPWARYVRAHTAMLAGALVLALAVGGWIGRTKARSRVAADRAAIASAYVQALDARAMATP
jgi:hypothetical protein